VAERAQAQGLALHVEPIDGPDALFGDPTRLLQALLNLLGNAVKFTDAGRIQLRAGLLERRGARVKLRLSVHHSGIGVPPERQASLLSAFVQADSSMTRRFGGTGQCLVITQRLARLMGGSAGMNSTPGVGSEFWLTVWLDQAPADMVAVDRPRASDADVDLGAGAAGAHSRRADLPQYSVVHSVVHSGPHCEAGLRRDHGGAAVLLVEDNPINQEVALELLRSVALDVDLASNGAEALQAIERRRYALVLMDMQMPVMDGLEATRRLRSLACHDDLPVLAMTANAYDEDREACLGAGMDGHVAQPVDRQRLFATVLHWLDQGRLRANKPA
jgi:CheY-like chemotaxis protein